MLVMAMALLAVCMAAPTPQEGTDQQPLASLLASLFRQTIQTRIENLLQLNTRRNRFPNSGNLTPNQDTHPEPEILRVAVENYHKQVPIDLSEDIKEVENFAGKIPY